jgi:aspartate kinase
VKKLKILVQKFGGTSINTFEKRMAVSQKIIQARNSGCHVVVVVSAMGRKGDPYATDTLLSILAEGKKNTQPKELDLLMSCGEIISGVLLTASLRSFGLETCFLTGSQAGIITDSQHGNASIKRVEPDKLIQLLEQGQILVIAGFQGISESGEVTTLGRGGSDTTAAAIGVALDAQTIEIYTDVEGIKTADPCLVNNARTLENITYSEACQLAYEGARIVHSRAVEIAMQKNIPLKIKCTFSDHPGTLISVNNVKERLITGITYSSFITQLKVKLPQGNSNITKDVFTTLAAAKISVDFITVLPENLIFTVKTDIAPKAIKLIENIGVVPIVKNNCAKVAAVGAGMTGIPGVMAKIVEALTEQNITILQSADSYTSIWCLVSQEELEKAVNALHAKFI